MYNNIRVLCVVFLDDVYCSLKKNPECVMCINNRTCGIRGVVDLNPEPKNIIYTIKSKVFSKKLESIYSLIFAVLFKT